MTKLLDHAIELVRDPPAAVQDDVVHLLLQLVGEADQPKLRLSSEDRAALDAADAEIARGAFATDGEMQALWTKPIP